MIKKLIFKLGQKIRNPSLNKWFSFLKGSEKWSLEELESYQLIKVKELVSFAYENSKFYRSKFDELGINHTSIKTLDDIKLLPKISKKDLIAFNDEIQIKNFKSKVFFASTSGTSGEELKFYRDETADSFNRASIFRGYSWCNVHPWERNGYFWGFNFSRKEQLKTRFLDGLQNRFRLFSFNNSAFEIFVNKLQKTTYLHGYSSAIYETAKKINIENLKKPIGLKMVKGTSEKIFEGYQNEIKKAFGLKMISEYGAAETGIIAFECPYGKMHINMEGVLVEEVNNEIIVTNLQMKSFPIIRYSLGDYIVLEPESTKCKCGKSHRIIKEVTGRIGKIVYGIKKQYPSLYFYYIFKNLAKNNKLELTYQVVQEKVGNLVFYIEQKLREKDQKLLEKEVVKYFKVDINYRIIDSHKFSSENKKLKSFISKL